MQRNVVVGGTSAGWPFWRCDHGAKRHGNTEEALTNPYNPYMTLDNTPFLEVPVLANTFTDTHFDNPDRRGRLLAFLARASQDWGTSATAIACDEYTAVCIDESGMARVFGAAPQYDDNAYILTVNCGLEEAVPETCSPGQALTESWPVAVHVQEQGTVTGGPSRLGG